MHARPDELDFTPLSGRQTVVMLTREVVSSKPHLFQIVRTAHS